MAEPTDQQLKHYAAELPKIYKYVLEAFAKASEERREGEPLPFTVIRQWVMLKDSYYRTGDVHEAILKLRDRGLVKRYHDPEHPPLHPGEQEESTWIVDWVPTELGEKLVAALTGRAPVRSVVPELPELVWN
jgi:hypothetical protein